MGRLPAELRVSFRDFWADFDPEDNFVVRALRQLTEVEVVDRGDLCVFSCFGDTHRTFAGPKVLVVGELWCDRRVWADWVIGFDPSSSDRVLQCPQWAWSADERLTRPTADNGIARPPRFCAFVYSDPRGDERNTLFQALSARRFVHAGGAAFRNDEGPGSRHTTDWQRDKRAYLRNFRFTIAAEREAWPHYCTEKLADAFLAGSVPIYWGDPTVGTVFNPRAFVHARDFGSPDELAEHVVALDDGEGWAEMRAEPAMTEESWRRLGDPHRLVSFLERVLTTEGRGTSRARRRALGAAPRTVAHALRHPTGDSPRRVRLAARDALGATRIARRR